MIGGIFEAISPQKLSRQIEPAENPMRNPGILPYQAHFSANHRDVAASPEQR